MGVGRDVLMLAIGAAVAESVRVGIDRWVKRGESKETRERARSVVARHMRRVGQQIDGIDTYLKAGARPGLEHVGRQEVPRRGVSRFPLVSQVAPGRIRPSCAICGRRFPRQGLALAEYVLRGSSASGSRAVEG